MAKDKDKVYLITQNNSVDLFNELTNQGFEVEFVNPHKCEVNYHEESGTYVFSMRLDFQQVQSIADPEGIKVMLDEIEVIFNL